MTGLDVPVVVSSDAYLLACIASAWAGDPGRCRWCNKVYGPPRRRWCSDECSNEFARNHWWSAASYAARYRDGYQCVVCKQPPREAFNQAMRDGVPGRLARRYLAIQVHHLTPVLGRHGVAGCHHHLDGLETVCLYHHLERHHGPTAQQLAIG